MELQTAYHPLEQPHELTTREKEDAMGAYLMMFAALGAGLPLPIINLLAAIIYYYIHKSKSRFVQFHAYQALIATVPTALINAGLMFWAIRIFFFEGWHVTNNFKGYVAAAVIANLAYFVIGIIAAIKARKGMYYYYIFFGKIAYQKVFAIKENAVVSDAPLNQPPRL
jgi:uncharacterized Tic20 family protein